MATRIFCDHCGNTIRDPIVFCFGPHKAVQDQIDVYRQMHVQHQYAQQGIAWTTASVTTTSGYVPTPPPPQATISSLEKIDLCQHCVSTWMSRVRNLTKESDA